MPEVNISDFQCRFRKGRGRSLANALLNDIMSCCKFKESQSFLASLHVENGMVVSVMFSR